MKIKFMRGLDRNAPLVEHPSLPEVGEIISLSGDYLSGEYRVREIHEPGSKLNPGSDFIVTLDQVANQ